MGTKDIFIRPNFLIGLLGSIYQEPVPLFLKSVHFKIS
jgi:hypothetical protein